LLVPVLLFPPIPPIGTPPTLKDVRYGPADIAPLELGVYAGFGLDCTLVLVGEVEVLLREGEEGAAATMEGMSSNS
jgi:hypothetical protein